MKKLGFLLTMAAVSMIGCGQESEPGGPGAAPRTGANGAANGKPEANGANGQAVDDARTFRFTVPGATVGLDQGAEEEVTITLDRGDEFREKVTLNIEPPAGVTGVTIEPRTVELAAGQDEVKVRIRANATAPAGEHVVTVKGTPETGKAVQETFKIKIDEGDAEQPADTPTREPAERPAGQEPAEEPGPQPEASGETPAPEPETP